MAHADFHTAQQSSAAFLACVALPVFNGLSIAATATRALERYSDLCDGQQARATLRMRDRIDIADEFLDLVVLNPESPAGFDFTGLSVAAFLAALYQSSSPPDVLRIYRSALEQASVQSLRDAARQRIQAITKGNWLRQLCLTLPEGLAEVPRRPFPAALAPLLRAADPAWTAPNRVQHTVAMLHTVAAPELRIPLRGKRFIRAAHGQSRGAWYDCRLMAQAAAHPDGEEYNELQLALPNLETSYFSPHFPVRNLLAHLRYSLWRTPTQARVMLVHEIQSDWLRDWRWQRLGRELATVRVMAGDRTPATELPPVPLCPYAQHWLAVAVEFLIKQAKLMDCDILAWVPGHLQHGLNPKLPLTVAERLYDQRLPAALHAWLVAHGYRGLALPVEYPCYAPQYNFLWSQGQGWRLVNSADEQPASPFYPTWDDALKQFQAQAQPLMVPLPGFLLD